MSGFSALRVASHALSAQQRALEVTAQNVANSATVGYTRQRADLQSLSASSISGLYATSSGVGEGVTADKVTRIRDAFLERRGQLEHGISAQAAALDTTWSQAELSFNEPGTTGLSSTLSSSWAKWGQLASTPTEPAARTAVIAASGSVVNSLTSTAKALDAQWNSTRVDVADSLTVVNSATTQIAELNRSIMAATANGLDSNELQDKRDVLIGTLADTIGATGIPKEDGSVDVVVGGATLVSGKNASTVSFTGPAASPGGATGTVALWATPGGQISAGGQMGGQVTALNSVLPGLRTELDTVAASIASSVNALQVAGGDKNGNPGTPLFGTTDGSTTVTAANIALAFTDGNLLAASKVTGLDAQGKAAADGGNADKIAQLAQSTTGPDATYRSMITRMGVSAAAATATAASSEAIVTQIDASRQSISGVSLDEEMTNMLTFKQSYAAMGRVISAMDEMLDVLINKTGLVGR
ncbi:flagellar hook-associated protein 1 FlgK [Klenkia soli]|uniref:Flagellar hook-associated protein 1 n=1 Tax=Klenkia soli TaxID=1052260 RepID=A0A1H0CKJ2_9ACTN|nr:flagellar hook-associated protein FlgK [Klenkia soli]SDN58311.1 flagellar hook-associated protein 1 FlgK [Klenkia soli]